MGGVGWGWRYGDDVYVDDVIEMIDTLWRLSMYGWVWSSVFLLSFALEIDELIDFLTNAKVSPSQRSC